MVALVLAHVIPMSTLISPMSQALSGTIAASSLEKGVARVALGSILRGQRRFALETLLGDSFSASDPHAEVNGVSGQDFMYMNILKNYESHVAYKILVGSWNAVNNLGNTVLQVPGAVADLFTQAEWTQIFAGLKAKTTKAILNKMLTKNYTSESGKDIEADYMDPNNVYELQATIKRVKGFIDNKEKVNDALAAMRSFNVGYEDSGQYYLNKLLPEFVYAGMQYIISSMQDLLTSRDNGGSKLTDAEKNMFATDSMLVASAIRNYDIKNRDCSTYQTFFQQYEEKMLFDGLESFLSEAGKVYKNGSGTLTEIVALNILFQQIDSVDGWLERTKNHSTATNAYQRMATIYQSQLDDMETNDVKSSIKSSLYNQALTEANKAIIKLAEKKQTKLTSFGVTVLHNTVNGVEVCSSQPWISDMVDRAALAKCLVKVGTGVAVGMSDTAEKIYELKLLLGKEETAKAVYQEDLQAYYTASNVKKEDAAKCVLDDLMYLKRIMLYGIATAYNCLKSQQDDTVLGWVAMSGNSEALQQWYQKQINALVDDSLYPISISPLVLNKDERLTILTTENGLEACLTKADGSAVMLAEVDGRLFDRIESLCANLEVSPTAFHQTGYRYRVTVSNAIGTVTSNTAILTVTGGESYRIISGNNVTWKHGSHEPLVFRADSDFSEFEFVATDDFVVDTIFYDAWSGSTFISLHEDYLSTLRPGSHVLMVCFTDGYALARFFIQDRVAAMGEGNSETPDTGDSAPILLLIGVILVSFAVCHAFRRRRYRSRTE